jgi:transposase
MQVHSVGIDLGKTTFHLVALGTAGKVLVRKKFNRKQLLAYTANMPASLIGLEACSGAHFLGRAVRKQGHDVKLIPAQFVKPFVKSHQRRRAVDRSPCRRFELSVGRRTRLLRRPRCRGACDAARHRHREAGGRRLLLR